MKDAPIAANEAERLAALQQLKILDTQSEERFDRLTRLGKQLFKVPYCVISLIDSDRQWFKSKQGLDVCETPRHLSFCGHTIHYDQLMVIPDTQKDPRFADNPLVVQAPNIRFYAGAVLHDDQGFALGTFCIFGPEPRELSPEQQHSLLDLAACVKDELLQSEERRLHLQLQQQQHLQQQILLAFPDMLFIVDAQGCFVYSNDHPGQLFKNHELRGKTMAETLPKALAKQLEVTLDLCLAQQTNLKLDYQLAHNHQQRDYRAQFHPLNQQQALVRVVDRTNELKKELELRQLAQVARQTRNLVVITDVQGRITWVNESFYQLSGYHQSEVLGHTPGSLLQGPDSDPQVIEQMRQALANQQGFEVELINYSKDKHPYWIRINCSPLLDDQQEVIGFIAIESDISEFKQQQAKLQREQQRLADIIQGTNIGTWEWNVQTGQTKFNERWANMLGYQLAELQPVSIETWIKLAHPDDLAESGKLLQAHFNGESTFYDCKARMKHKDGHWIWVHDRGRVVRWTEDGKPLMMYGTHADITDERLLAEELSSQRQFLDNIFSSNVTAITVLDAQGQIVFANTQAEQILGLEVLSHQDGVVTYDSPLWQITALDGAEFPHQQLPFVQVSTTGKAVYDVQHAIRWPDGSWRALSINGAPMPDANDQARFVFAIQDITVQVEAQQALQESEAQFRSLVANIPGITYRCQYDDDWTMLYISSQVDPLSGYPASDFLLNSKRSYDSIIHPDDKSRLAEAVAQALAKQESWQLEYRILHANGQTRWALEKGQGIYDEQGQVRYLDGFILDITERKESAAQVEHQRWLYEQIIDRALAGFWDWYIQQDYEYLSPKFKQTFGYADHEMANHPSSWQQLAFAEDLVAVQQNFARHLESRGEVPFDNEVRYRHRDGSLIWIRCIGTVVEWDAKGQAVRMIGCHINISLDKARSEQIQQQLQAFTALNNITANTDPSLNQQLKQALMIGCNLLKLSYGFISQGQPLAVSHLASPYSELLHPEQKTELNALPSSLASSVQGLLALTELDPSNPDHAQCQQRLGWRSYLGIPIFTGQQLSGYLNFAGLEPREHFSQSEILFVRLLQRWLGANIERLQHLQNLRTSESRFRGLFELSPVGIALNDYATGQFIEINQALLQPTGYSLDEFVQLSYFQITPEEYYAQEQQQLISLEQTGRYGPFEKEYIRKDGGRYPVLLNGVLLTEQDGRKVIWSMIEDISERKRNERLKNEFISTISHELRTPLTALNGVLALLANHTLGPINEQQQKMLQMAQNNSQRLVLLINDLLDMEKLMAGKLEVSLQPQALLPLLQQAIDDNHNYAKQHGVELVLLPCASQPWVEVDTLRFSQVLANLLSNAAKFSNPGAKVWLEAEQQGRQIFIHVRDQGRGIQPEFQPRIFEKFAQEDSSDTRSKGGTGLGLAISKELIELMHGQIGFSSIPNQQTDFYLVLPMVHSSGG